MGTRSITYVHDDSFDSEPFTAIYRQFDGYPTGAGADIKAAIGEKALVNGISGDRGSVVNGMGCAAAQLIKSLKEEAGNIYVEAPTIEPAGVDYVYRLAGLKTPGAGAAIHFRVIDPYSNRTLYDGPLASFDAEACEAQDRGAV